MSNHHNFDKNSFLHTNLCKKEIEDTTIYNISMYNQLKLNILICVLVLEDLG